MAADSPNRYNLIRALARSAFRVADANEDGSVTPTSVLEDIQSGKFGAEITDGKSSFTPAKTDDKKQPSKKK